MLRLGLTCHLLLVCAVCSAGEFVCPPMTTPPTMDGVIDAYEWSRAVRVDGFGFQGRLEQRRATGYLGATKTHIYVAIASQLPDEGELVTECERSSENLVFDDSIEVWIDPYWGEERGARFQALANSQGHAWYKMHGYGGMTDDPAWRGGWEFANSLADGLWQCEVAIPIASVREGISATERALGLNLCRNWKQEWAFSSISMGGYAPEDAFTFTTQATLAPSLTFARDPFAGLVTAGVFLRNAGTTEAGVEIDMLLERDVMPGVRSAGPVTVAPGEAEGMELAVDDMATQRFALTVGASVEGRTILSRQVAWERREALHWVTHKQEIAPVDFQFAYYPYLNVMRIVADVSNLPEDATLESLSAHVRSASGEEVASAVFNDLVDGRQEVRLELPPLEGRYEIALGAAGPGVPEAEVVKSFARTVFPWEHTQLGRSTTVYPPFTPIEVEGRRVSTVLREHTMGATGLWDQVVSLDRDLLAGPMRLESGGRTATGDGPRFVMTEGHRAIAESELWLEDLEGSVLSSWDVDGMMRVDMTLAASGAQTDELTLVIPLRAEEATHYHAMGDGIRNTLYDRIPVGEGVVWDSRLTRANDIPEGFCSYIFVGTPRRGLCWFAENDAGWGWDASTPNVEIARSGDTVEVRVHLINRPTTLDSERTITFGLQAAPVKPRIPGDWRHKYRRDRYSLLGTDINWLALGDCGSVYPAGGDMFLWEMIAEGNRRELTEEEIQSVIEAGRPYFEPYGEDRVAAFENHARYNLTARRGTRMIYYYNRASFQAAEEFETFKDEWGLTDLRSIEAGNGIWEIKIVPTDSYIDHALYWYDRSFDVGGNQGVYWDNWFFVGSYNTAMASAYQASDGRIVPSTGLWGLRELARRTFILMNERGMLPITMAHMTSTNILPLHGFCTVQYDWEWKYSEGDVQDRFTREYIQLVSNGELAGTWPVLLGDHGPQADDPWVGRTFAGVAMVHELDCAYPGYTETGRMQQALLAPIDALLEREGLRVYRYWDDTPPPIVATHPDLPTIVYSVPGEEAVCAVVSYADGDVEAELVADLEALGFAAGVSVEDAETGETVALEERALRFTLRKHDVRVLRLAPDRP